LLQRELGGNPGDYWKAGASADIEVERAIQVMGESDELELGIDGCGVPVFAAPMRNIAVAFKNLAVPERISDGALQQAAMEFAPRMHRYPHMMRGDGYPCTILNSDPNIVAKGGANGVYGFGLKKERLGVAFKLLDGTENAWPLIIREILRGLGALAPKTEELLNTLHPAAIYNKNDTLVGMREAVFKVTM